MMIIKNEPFTEANADLFPIHRLDRLTSGLLIFAKSKTSAAEMSKYIRDRSTSKVSVISACRGWIEFVAVLMDISEAIESCITVNICT